MYIEKINVKNFRMLKNFSIDLEKDLSLVIGKNNVGKTSLLSVLDNFLSAECKPFRFNDFNLDFQNEIISLIQRPIITDDKDFESKAIKLQLIIKYDENDSLENIGNILLNLDSDNFYFSLGFEYLMSYDSYLSCIKKYNEDNKKDNFDIREWFCHNYKAFFKITRKSLFIDKNGNIDENQYIDLDKKGFSLNNIISFNKISAIRDVDNEANNKTLSKQTSEFYTTQQNTELYPNQEIDEFRVSLMEQDVKLTKSYEKVFKGIIDKIAKFGGVYPDESSIKICSALSEDNLLKNNTLVLYKHGNANLPEYCNGLGYMNLISMIFEIEINKKKFERNGKPSDINLLFIEEPEAHTHPQMQYIFIKNIKDLLKEGITCEGKNRAIQSIISTHSAHIVSSCENFDDIKYLFRKNDRNETEAKNLSYLKVLYGGGENKYYKFLKQYLTINRSELFFADKVICIEGDTERILLPAMMKKFDDENYEDNVSPLLSQNISIIEVGAHAEIFDKFFRFMELKKILILTDFDCCESQGYHKKNYYISDNGMITSNSCINHYFDNKLCDYLSSLDFEKKHFKWDDTKNKMVFAQDGNVSICYQVSENGYQPRSFEDDFFALNETFIKGNIFSNSSIQGGDIDASKPWAYALSEKVNSKSSLAVEILLNSVKNETTAFGNWEIPTYIKEGLKWLRK